MYKLIKDIKYKPSCLPQGPHHPRSTPVNIRALKPSEFKM